MILKVNGVKNYQHILFDLDGTLTDPGEGIIRSIQYALAKMGIEEPDPMRLRAFIGPPLKESFERYYALKSDDAWRAVEYYREYFREKGMFENYVYSGIPELLFRLKDQHKKLWVATSKPTEFSEQILRHFQLDGFFEAIIGSNLDGSRVEKGEVIAYLLEQFPEISPESAVMVGDRKHDILGARANGMDAIGVGYGYGSRAELEAVRPMAIAVDAEDLMKLLLKTPKGSMRMK